MKRSIFLLLQTKASFFVFRDTLIISIVNSGTSILAGFAIFSALGFMADEMGVEVKDVAESGKSICLSESLTSRQSFFPNAQKLFLKYVFLHQVLVWRSSLIQRK